MTEIRKTCSSVFAKGEAIETIWRAGSELTVGLLYWDGKIARMGTSLELHGTLYEPADIETSFLRALKLPSNIEPYGSAHTLLTEIATIVGHYSGLSEHFSRLFAFFMAATWVPECGPMAPRIFTTGPPSRETDQLMRLIHCFCRHAVLLSGVTAGGLLSLPFEFGLTVVIRQSRLGDRLQELLNASTTASQFVLWNGHLANPCCSLVLHTDERLRAPMSFSGIEIPMWPTRHEVAFLDAHTEKELAAHFQNKLLAFRLATLAGERKIRFDPAELSSPLREVACSLGACFSNDPELQKEIVDRLRSSDRHARLLRSTNQEAILLEALLYFCHERNGEPRGSVRVSEIANAMRVINVGRGETFDLKPRAVGEILRRLAFLTTRLDKRGRGIILCRDITDRVHELAMNFGVPSMRKGTPGCSTCERVRKTVPDQDDKRWISKQ